MSRRTDDALGEMARAFLDAIAADPDDIASYLVYGDFLQSRSHPRGELIALQAGEERARMNASRPSALGNRPAQDRIRELLTEHADELTGWRDTWQWRFAKDCDRILRHRWFCGFLHEIAVQLPDVWVEQLVQTELARLLHQLLAHPSARVVRTLTLGACWQESYTLGPAPESVDQLNRQIVRSLVDAGERPVRSLQLGDFSGRHVARGHFGDLSTLLRLYPRLQELTVRGNCDLGERLPLLSLRHLELWFCERGPDHYYDWDEGAGIERGERQACMLVVLSSLLPELSTLILEFGTRHRDVASDVLPLGSLLEGKRFPRLRHLGLRRHHGEDCGVLLELLASAPLLARLERLDLSDNALEDEHVELILRQPERFRHLRELDLRDNLLSDETVEALAALPNLRTFGQRQEYDDP